MIHWCRSRLPVEITANVSMWHRKEILFLSDFPRNVLIPGRLLSVSRVVGILWVDFVENILEVNEISFFLQIVCLCCNHNWKVLQRFCKISLSYRGILYMCMIGIGGLSKHRRFLGSFCLLHGQMILAEVGLFGFVLEFLGNFCKYILNLGDVCVFLNQVCGTKFIYRYPLVFNIIIFRVVFVGDVVYTTTLKAALKLYRKSTEIIGIFYLVRMKFPEEPFIKGKLRGLVRYVLYLYLFRVCSDWKFPYRSTLLLFPLVGYSTGA